MSSDGITRAMARVEEITGRIQELARRPPAEQPFADVLKEASPSSGVPEQFRPLIERAAVQYNLPSRLIESIARQESSFNPNAVSPVGAQGLMQIMPQTQKELGITDPFDPAQSIDGGSRYVRMMLDRFGGNLPHALAAYNAGPHRVDQYRGIPPFAETQNYVTRILSDMEGTDD